MTKNFQVTIQVPKVRTLVGIFKDDKRNVRMAKVPENTWLRPYVKETLKFCLN